MCTYPYNRGVIGVVNGFKATDAFEALRCPKAPTDCIMVAAGQYQILGRVGDSDPARHLRQALWPDSRADDAMMRFCNQPDGNMFLPTNEDGSEGYLYTNYECRRAGSARSTSATTAKSWEVLEGEKWTSPR